MFHEQITGCWTHLWVFLSFWLKGDSQGWRQSSALQRSPVFGLLMPLWGGG
jgi:hypothetical protein